MPIPVDATLDDIINYFENNIEGFNNLPSWYVPLFKTLASKSVTINDWNQLFEMVKRSLSQGLTITEVMVALIENLKTLSDQIDYYNKLGDIGKNHSNLDLPAGAPVSWAGVEGSHKLFTTALASDPTRSKMVGVLRYASNKNAFTPVLVFGNVEVANFADIVDSASIGGIIEGSRLYLSATEAGKYSTTIPDRPNAALWLATITELKNNNSGKIFVYEINYRAEGGLWIEVAQNEPVGQVTGDFWYDVEP